MNLKDEYITGFVDGEGTFNIVKYDKGRTGPQFLVFNTNLKILKQIKETLHIKSPIFEVSRTKDVIKRRRKCYRLQARSKDDIAKVVAHFDQNPPIVKEKDYKKFREAYEKRVSTTFLNKGTKR